MVDLKIVCYLLKDQSVAKSESWDSGLTLGYRWQTVGDYLLQAVQDPDSGGRAGHGSLARRGNLSQADGAVFRGAKPGHRRGDPQTFYPGDESI